MIEVRSQSGGRYPFALVQHDDEGQRVLAHGRLAAEEAYLVNGAEVPVKFVVEQVAGVNPPPKS